MHGEYNAFSRDSFGCHQEDKQESMAHGIHPKVWGIMVLRHPFSYIGSGTLAQILTLSIQSCIQNQLYPILYPLETAKGNTRYPILYPLETAKGNTRSRDEIL